jgi:hypothetical protein
MSIEDRVLTVILSTELPALKETAAPPSSVTSCAVSLDICTITGPLNSTRSKVLSLSVAIISTSLAEATITVAVISSLKAHECWISGNELLWYNWRIPNRWTAPLAGRYTIFRNKSNCLTIGDCQCDQGNTK